MQVIQQALKKWVAEHRAIRVAMIGCGFMGRSLLSQIRHIQGIEVVAVASRSRASVDRALNMAGYRKDQVHPFKNDPPILGDIYIVDDIEEALKMDWVDVFVDCTGDPYDGMRLSERALSYGKHVVTLNVEGDVVVGPYLARLAKRQGKVYSGIAGDEPGTLKELYDFCVFLGLEVVCLGKGKNNPLDTEATFQTVSETALQKGISPSMLASFVDGSKTMEELTMIANATGFLPDCPGCHGVACTVDALDKRLIPEEHGGILRRSRVVEYVRGVAPGVFAIVQSFNPLVDEELRFLKVGEGPYYTLYRPYHLTSIEAPISIASAVLCGTPTIAPLDGPPVADTVAIAKRDLHPGQLLDGPGGESAFGRIYEHAQAVKNGWLPFGFVSNRLVVQRFVPKGQVISYADVLLPDHPLVMMRKHIENSEFF